MKEILTHLKSEWYKYALETLVVIIGILVAFALNNWNEDRKRAKQEDEILSALILALETDLKQFDKHIETSRTLKYPFTYMIPHLKAKKAHNDTLGQCFAVLTTTAQFDWTPNLTAYSILESKGLDILQNDSLTASILEVYNRIYPRIQHIFENYKGNVLEYGRPMIRRKFVAIKHNEFTRFRPVDYAATLDDVELMNVLINLEENNERNLGELETFRQEVSLVIKEIEKELENN